MPRWLIMLVAVVAAAACMPVAAGGAAAPRRGAAPSSVIALTEIGGLNVLHEDFRTKDGQDVTLPPGAPKPVRVELPKTGTFEERVAQARKGPLGRIKKETLYYIAGTRLFIYLPPGREEWDLFTDGDHATGTSSAAVGNKWGTNPNALLIYMPASEQGWRWLSEQQRWIDTISVSYYSVFSTAQNRCAANPLIRKISAGGRIVFVAAGNMEQAGIISSPSGSPDAYQVGGVDSDGKPFTPATGEGIFSGGFPTRPYETGDRMDFPAAAADSLTQPQPFGGTSGATPSTAGRATLLIEHARKLLRSTHNGVVGGKLAVAGSRAIIPRRGPLADGDLTAAELTKVLHNVAVPFFPQNPLRYYLEGYGHLNEDIIDRAKRVLSGLEKLEPRPEEDTQHAQWEDVRRDALQKVCF